MSTKPVMWCPGVAVGDELRRGLCALWPFWEGSGSTLMDVSGRARHGTLTNMDPATDWVASERGMSLDFDGSNDKVFASAETIQTPPTFSCFAVIRFDSADVTKYIFDTSNGAAGFGLRTSASNGLNLIVYRTGGLSNHALYGAFTVGQWHTITGVLRASVSELWVDGHLKSTFGGRPTGDLIQGDTLGIGADYAGANNINANMAMGALWNRDLSHREVAELHQGTFRLISPPRKTYFWESASSVDKHYNLYTGKGSLNDVDFDTIVAEYPEGTATGDYIGLDPGVSSTYTLVLRPEIDGLETPDISAITEFVTDGSGEWVGLRPDPVQGFSGQAIAGGIIRLTWNHRIYDGATPDDFLISYGTTPSASGSTTTVTYDGAKKYTEDITLSDGVTYWFRLQARDGSILSASRVIGGIAADATAPSAPTVTIATTWQTLPQ